jgi:hypothetical protein
MAGSAGLLTSCQSGMAGSAAQETTTITPIATLEAGTAATPFPTLVPPDAENVPLYADARTINRNSLYPQDWRRIRYQTSATTRELVDFYNEQLSSQGWVFTNGPVQRVSGQAFIYKWTDSREVVPWDLSLEVLISGAYQGKIRDVDLDLHRVPNLDRIPLYPHARKVEVQGLPSKFGERFRAQLTTYVTDAAPEVVEAYYRMMLPQHGWSEPPKDDDIKSKGLLFSWGTGGMHALKVFHLDIVASEEPEGGTRIQVKLDGTILR